MGDIKNGIITFSKAQCSAWIATAIDFGVTLLLSKLCGLWYGYATFAGALSGGCANCVINYRWVFHAFGEKKKYVAIRYLIVWWISIVLNTVGTCQLTETLHIDFVIAKAIIAALVAVLWNYQMQRVFVFHANKNNKKQNKI